MNQHERNEKIELYGCGYDNLIEALKDIPPEMWKFKPAPEEWSIHEVLIHLADSESNAALRARKLIVEPGGTLMGYDQEKWTGYEVVLVEKQPSIGGVMAQLDKTYPTMDCSI